MVTYIIQQQKKSKGKVMGKMVAIKLVLDVPLFVRLLKASKQRVQPSNVSFCLRLPQLSTSKPCKPLKIVSRLFGKFLPCRVCLFAFPNGLEFRYLGNPFSAACLQYCFGVSLSPHVYVFGSFVSGIEFAWFLQSPHNLYKQFGPLQHVCSCQPQCIC